MSAKIYTGAEAQAIHDAVRKNCGDCDGIGHYLCPECGDGGGESCGECDDERHVRCDLCRGAGRIDRRDVGAPDSELVDDLAATVIRMERERDVLAEAVAIASKLITAAQTERDAARAIIEGRTTPPTREECDALVAGGGWWRCAEAGSQGMAMCVDYDDVALVLRDAATEGVTLRWWAHDRTGRPCAWPTVTP